MIGVIKRFRNNTPLQGCAVAIINRKTFVIAPTESTMVDDDMFFTAAVKCIFASASINLAILALPLIT